MVTEGVSMEIRWLGQEKTSGNAFIRREAAETGREVLPPKKKFLPPGFYR
jgi:hypothetical protein